MLKTINIDEVYWKLAKQMISGEYEMTSLKDVIEVAIDELARKRGIPYIKEDS